MKYQNEPELSSNIYMEKTSERGHRFLNNLNLWYKDLKMDNGFYDQWGNYIHVTGLDANGNYLRTNLGYPHGGRPYEQHGSLSDQYHTYKEDFADSFMNWALGQCTDDEAGRVRCGWVDSFVREHIKYNPAKDFSFYKEYMGYVEKINKEMKRMSR